ncbi:MAG: flagellar hook-length control protein FliK [Zoogloeaceae bacterium]|jgi:flagellar hook-length control protein FliK|nr:flagellar hook-length control protein FliK [Zoogloeaceae bacterium]
MTIALVSASAALSGVSGGMTAAVADAAESVASGFAGLFAQSLEEGSLRADPNAAPEDTLANILRDILSALNEGDSESLENLAATLQKALARQDADQDEETENALQAILGTLQLPGDAAQDLRAIAERLSGQYAKSQAAADAALDSSRAAGKTKKDEENESAVWSSLANFLGKKGEGSGSAALSAAGAAELPISANLAGGISGKSGKIMEARADDAGSGREFSQLLRAFSPAANAASAQHTPAASGTNSAALSAPVASEAWGRQLGEQMLWMVKNDLHTAQIKLNPAHLGPLSITLRLEGDQATARFVAATPEVRQAIEDAMPRLREMMAASGVSLAQTDVGESPRRDPSEQTMSDFYGRERENRQNEPQNDPLASGAPPAYGEKEEGAPILAHDMETWRFHEFAQRGGIDLFA